MRFTADHRFEGTPEAVAAALGDASFYRALTLPDLGPAEVLEDDAQDQAGHRLLLRYEYIGHIDPLARGLLGGARLTWTQEVRVSRDGGTLSFAAEANPALLHGEAAFTLSAEGTGTRRRLDGELVVALPGFGAMAERRIVPGVLGRLDVEAAAVNEQLGAR